MSRSEKEKVTLYTYTIDWQSSYNEEEKRLQSLNSEYIIEIQHIGSTAIPGMLAKPIIDIGIAVQDFDQAKRCIKPIISLEYEYKGEFGIKRRHYFVKGNPSTYHLHVLETTSDEWKNHIWFRDYLKEHPDVADEYANLKRNLAQQFTFNRQAYQEGKIPFIIKILALRNKKELEGKG
ncbi:MAG: GrpB family protein [Candidatus Hodarchaeales archaeon]|jgi:GrpB-like predicted nucleotidyltransferase (UPF0157 family)